MDVGNGVMANGLTFNGTIPGPEFRLEVGQTVVVQERANGQTREVKVKLDPPK